MLKAIAAPAAADLQQRRRPGGWAAPPPARRARLHLVFSSAAAGGNGAAEGHKRLTILHFNDVSRLWARGACVAVRWRHLPQIPCSAAQAMPFLHHELLIRCTSEPPCTHPLDCTTGVQHRGSAAGASGRRRALHGCCPRIRRRAAAGAVQRRLPEPLTDERIHPRRAGERQAWVACSATVCAARCAP